jgi:hypothetical protein
LLAFDVSTDKPTDKLEWAFNFGGLTAGTDVMLPNSALELAYRVGPQLCTIHSGTLQWMAPPSWSVTFKNVMATCGSNSIVVNASFSGNR